MGKAHQRSTAVQQLAVSIPTQKLAFYYVSRKLPSLLHLAHLQSAVTVMSIEHFILSYKYQQSLNELFNNALPTSDIVFVFQISDGESFAFPNVNCLWDGPATAIQFPMILSWPHNAHVQCRHKPLATSQHTTHRQLHYHHLRWTKLQKERFFAKNTWPNKTREVLHDVWLVSF